MVLREMGSRSVVEWSGGTRLVSLLEYRRASAVGSAVLVIRVQLGS